MIRTNAVAVCCFAIGLVCSGSYATPLSAGSKEMSISAVLALTGPAAIHGTAIKDGLELAKEALEKDGWKIHINYQDDETDSKKTVSAVRASLATGNKFFVGPTWSFQVNAVRRILSSSGAVSVLPTASSDINGGATKGIFNLAPKVALVESPLTKWLASKSYDSGCLFTPNGDWGEMHRAVFKSSLTAKNIKIVDDEAFDYGIDKIAAKSYFVKISSKQCKALFVTGGSDDIANIIKARDELALGIDIIATDGVSDALDLKLFANNNQNANIFVIGLHKSPSFEKLYMEKYHHSPETFAVRGFDAVGVFAKAIEATDGSSEEVIKFLSHDFSYPGESGRIAFDDSGDITGQDYEVRPL